MDGMILCIDDEPVGLRVRKLLLESQGYQVLTATSGREGLELFAAHPVSAVILDYAMPEMNGDQVAFLRLREVSRASAAIGGWLRREGRPSRCAFQRIAATSLLLAGGLSFILLQNRSCQGSHIPSVASPCTVENEAGVPNKSAGGLLG
jgi:CheY-like chemotaxis protein